MMIDRRLTKNNQYTYFQNQIPLDLNRNLIHSQCKRIGLVFFDHTIDIKPDKLRQTPISKRSLLRLAEKLKPKQQRERAFIAAKRVLFINIWFKIDTDAVI